MTVNSVSTYLKFANLQMAAEARFPDAFSGAISTNILTLGNGRSSKFTDVLAEQFAKDWEVVEHKADTTTGFSGTLFRARQDNESLGIKQGELVMSFRSTEFADDAARDNEATNAQEIKPFGWAFGQISDMKAWYDSLLSSGKLSATDQFAVTGYSLGGHLATAFNQLLAETGQASKITSTYTFNGAGVGEIKSGSLTAAIDLFNSHRDTSNEAYFQTTLARNLYLMWRPQLNAHASSETMAAAMVDVIAAKDNPTAGTQTLAELDVLINAIGRAKRVRDEADRVAAGISSGGNSPSAQPVGVASIAATQLDYQMAVLQAQTLTRPFASTITDGLGAAYATNRAPLALLGAAPIYDIYGAPLPSAVSNSQHHYGAPTPIFIEDQPLMRGSIVASATGQSLLFGEAKLLVSGFANNDFGDTHSLVLIVDSLSMQDTIARLMPGIAQGAIESVFRAASDKKAVAVPFTQGSAEGDVLEDVLNALNHIFRGPDVTKVDGKLEGGTWANIADRNVFYDSLKLLQESPAFKAAIGKVTISPTAGQSSLPTDARTDFGSFLSLLNLSPFVVKATSDATAVEATLAASWGAAHTDWQTDKDAVAAGKPAENYTDTWLNDRQALLQWEMVNNLRNLDGILTPETLRRSIPEATVYEDKGASIRVQVGLTQATPSRQVVFGGNADEAFVGSYKDDHFYGGTGADTLTGLGGADYLEGNADADSLDGGEGADTLLGGTGNDTLDGGLKNDLLKGGAGKDSYNFAQNWGDDIIVDSDGDGLINVAGIGDINGAGAKKTIDGRWETSDHKIRYAQVPMTGGTFDLLISFSDRPDTIRIENWKADKNVGIDKLPDAIEAPVLPTTLVGDIEKKRRDDNNTQYDTNANGYASGGSQGGAADVLLGGEGGEELRGLGGNDGITGREGDDLITGGEGDDLLLGGTGIDTINGGAGNDLIFGSAMGWIATPGSVDFTAPEVPTGDVEITRGFSWVAYRGAGDRWEDGDAQFRVPGVIGAYVGADFRASDGQIYVEASGNIIDAGEGDDIVGAGTGDDVVQGGEGDDDLYGIEGDDLLFGDAGSDFIKGDGQVQVDAHDAGYGMLARPELHGNDTLVGGAGRDVLLGQGGDDELYGGTEDDVMWGDDTDLTDTPLEVHGNDYMDGGDGDDQMSGGGRDDTMMGGAGKDSMWGDGDGADTVTGEFQGQDYLDGEDGDDQLKGGGNDDTVFGGDGKDLIWGDDKQEITPLANQGRDYLDGEAGDDQVVGGGNDDTLFGGEGDDTLWGDDEEARVPKSSHGNDYIDGEAGKDELSGNGGDDTLLGGEGDDLLWGDEGNDRLDGGAGTDYLNGGDGNDTYVVRAGDMPLNGNGESETIDDLLGVNTLVFEGISASDVQFVGVVAPAAAAIAPAGFEAMSVNAEQDAEVSDSGLTIVTSTGERVGIINGTGGAVSSFEFADGTTLSLSQLIGQFADQVAYGTLPNGAVRAMGGRQSDGILTVGDGAVLSGGRGDDEIAGAGGGNSYLFDRGDGNDVITDGALASGSYGVAGASRIVFGAGVVAADLSLTASNGRLVLNVGGGWGDSIAINGFDRLNASGPLPIDEIRFSDGSSMTMAQLLARGFDFGGTDGNDSLAGTSLGDRFASSLGNDTLDGGAGADAYTWGLGSGQDTVIDAEIGMEKTDVLHIGSGLRVVDLTFSRSGDDWIIKSRTGPDQITVAGQFAWAGVEKLVFDDGTVWLRSEFLSRLTNGFTEGSDNYIGTPGDDSVLALGGNDTLYGREGNDFIDGGAGDDYLYGEDGADTLLGGDGADALVGAAGDDVLDGGASSDVLQGGDGNDALSGGAGGDNLLGQAGNDSLNGGLGVDQLDGGDGNDVLTDGSFADYLQGGAGNDTLVGGLFMTGGDGSDLYVLGSAPVTQTAHLIERVTVAADVDSLLLPAGATLQNVAFYREATDTSDNLVLVSGSWRLTVDNYFWDDASRSGLEEIRLSDGTVLHRSDIVGLLGAQGGLLGPTAGDDSLIGLRFDETLDGGSGNDLISGMSGNDSLIGGLGNDSLYGGSGSDVLDGGAGQDLLTGGTGTDTYRFGVGYGKDSIWESGSASAEIDTIALAPGVAPADVVLMRDGLSLVLILNGSTTQLTVANQFSSSGDNQVERITFADGTVWNATDIAARTVSGSINTLTGTSGNDSFVVDNAADVVVEAAGGGTDTIQSSVSYTLPGNVENLTATGSLNSRLVGNDLNNVLTGNASDNTLNDVFSVGSDTLVGGGGDDIYYVNGFGGAHSSYYSASTNDTIVEQVGEGYDTIVSNNFYIQMAAQTEALVDRYYDGTWTQGSAILGRTLLGNSADNAIIVAGGLGAFSSGSTIPIIVPGEISGSSSGSTIRSNVGGVIRIDGGAGADVMTGSYEDTTYVVDNAGDVVRELNTLGFDTVETNLSYALGDNLEGLVLTGSSAVSGTGNALANRMDGSANAGSNVLRGGLGDDTYVLGLGDTAVEAAGEGFDTVIVKAAPVAGTAFHLADHANVESLDISLGNGFSADGTARADVLVYESYYDTTNSMAGGSLFGLAGDDSLTGGGGADVLDGGTGVDRMDGGTGNDLYRVDNAGDVVVDAGGYDSVESSIDYALSAGIEAIVAAGNIGLRLTGTSLNNTLDGSLSSGADTLIGGAGDDQYIVGLGDTIVELAGEGNDSAFGKATFSLGDNVEAGTLQGMADADLTGGAGANDLTGNDGANHLFGAGGNDTLRSSLGVDTLAGGDGSDVYAVDVTWALGTTTIVDNSAVAGTPDLAKFNGNFSSVTWQRIGNDLRFDMPGAKSVTVSGYYDTANPSTVRQFDFAGTVYGDADFVSVPLTGTAGADALVGAAGNDNIQGLEGDDLLVGNAGADTLNGGAGNDTLDGGVGNDSLVGGAGDDRYLAVDDSEAVIELANEGVDTVESSGNYGLRDNVENLILTGSAASLGYGNALDNEVTGNSANNNLYGFAGNDTLDGAGGADTMVGGLGNDTYRVDVAGDVVTELANEGTDTVESGMTYTLTTNIENLKLTGAGAINGTGTSANNLLTGNTGANRLDGGSGADTMNGGLGDDTYVVDNAGDLVNELASGGLDAVESSITWALAAELEKLTLTGAGGINGAGNALANTLIGNSGANRLDGGAGADSMTGGAGDDTYVIDNVGDAATEAAGGGTDTIESSITWTLGVELENLTLTGVAAVSATGNSVANTLRGNAGDNILNGGTGNDSMLGGAGNDTYVVDVATDAITENAGEGTDTVQSAVTWTLGSNLENLVLTGTSAINATGNSANNVLNGNAAVNTLSGGAGADTMSGAAGNDIYVVDNTGDVVNENASEGTDLVQSSVTYALAANVENLTLTGTGAINATGNTLVNALIGNSGANRLDGGAGADSMTGGAGNDTYVVDNAGDIVVEVASGGTDTVEASVAWTLGTEVENLTLTGSAAINATGNTLANTLRGNAGNNVLDGGTGSDTMIGGAGDDVYKVDAAADVVTEAVGEGRDRVESIVTLTLSANVDDLTLLGTTAINGTGNALDNVLIGNGAVNSLTGGAGNDSLNGNAGADTMAGGTGNDAYFVDNAADVTTEAGNEGTDTVNSTVTWTLGSNLENLTLLGSAAINGIGNTLDNILTGNSGANTLTGNAGNDTLDGGTGADTLIGGTGNDKYMMGRGYGAELVQENDATAGNADVMQFLSGVATDQIWFRKVGNDLEVSIIGTTDKSTVQNWYLGGQYHVEQFKTSDGKTLLDSKVQDLVSAMASFTPPAVGQTTLPSNYQTTLLPVIAADWGP